VFLQVSEATERVRNRQALAESDAKAREAEQRHAAALLKAIEARDNFLSIASHELRTPITGLTLQNHIMTRALAKEDAPMLVRARLERFVQQTARGLNRLNRLVDDMLDITRIDQGRLVLDVEPTDWVAHTREVLERYADDLSRAGITHKLIAESPELVLPLDRFRMEQVLTNLITNAVRYAPRTAVQLQIRVNGPHAELVFEDAGPGIAEEHRERVFERFERLVPSNEVSGLGLGLFISRQIVRMHGGELRLERGESGGARFLVRLPRPG
jgi:signal transduction histidine kinase